MSDHIQIGATAPRIQYTADGAQTVFPYPFPIFEAADLEVYLDAVAQSSGFTVSGVGISAGGSVLFASAPAAGALVTLRRNIAIARTSDFQEGGALRAKVLNDELDRLTASLQQVATALGRSLVLSPVDPADGLVLPSLAERAGALLGFDASGLPYAFNAATFKGDKGDKGDKGEDGLGIGDMRSANNLSELADAAAARLNLALGSAALAATADFATASHTHVMADVTDFSGGADQTARDQIALTNLRLLLNSSVASGALAQGYQWELASDEWAAASTNQIFTSSTPNYYGNPGGYSSNLIPTMTGNTAPSGVASASCVETAGQEYYAFDASNSTGWWTPAGTTTGWLAYQFASSTVVNKYAITDAGNVATAPKAWTFEGWSGSAWIVLDTRSGVTFSGGQTQAFTFSNSTAYLKYRLNVTQNGGHGTYLGVATLAMFSAMTPANMTLISPTAISVASPPIRIAAYFLWKDDSGSAELGTDLTVELSRDGGTTWTASTITPLAAFDGAYSVIKARADVSEQPSGTSLRMRIKTLNNKAQRIAAPVIYEE